MAKTSPVARRIGCVPKMAQPSSLNETERAWHPATATIHPDALQAIARAWATRQDAFVRSRHLNGRVVLLQGEPRDADDLKSLVQMLYVGDIEVRPADSFGGRGRASLGSHLWHAAGLRAPHHPVTTDDLVATLVDGPTIVGVGRLPLGQEIRRLLAFRDDPRASLQRLLSEAATRLDVVAGDLSRLLALGALRLRTSKGGGSRPRPTRRRAPTKAPPVRKPRPLTERNVEQVRARLERELGLITDADDYTVVGVSPGMPAPAVRRACERMTERYAAMMDDERLPGRVRDLAQEIHARVLLAVGRIQDGSAHVGTPGVSGDPMRQGHKFLDEGRPELAARCFAKARHDTGSPQATAWLGWALFANAAKSDTVARQKGRELVELATNTSDFLADPAYLMARIDFQEGNLVRSWNWLEKAMKIEPDHEAGGELLARVRAELNKER